MLKKTLLFLLSMICLSNQLTASECEALTQATSEVIATVQDKKLQQRITDFITQITPHHTILVDVIRNSKSEEEALKLVPLLISDYHANVNADYYFGTPLIAAIQKKYHEVINLLLKNNANVDAHNEYYGTPLLWAVAFGDIKIIELLLKKGANPNIKDSSGVFGGTPLISATFSNNIAFVKVLIESGAKVDEYDKNKCTSLMYAAFTGNIEIVQLLLQHKANRWLRNSEGQTAKDIAQEKGHTEIVKLLS